MTKITPFGWVVIALTTVVTITLIGAIYFESMGDYISALTRGTLLQNLGGFLGSGLHEIGHSLAIAWIFVAVMLFIIICVIAIIKLRNNGQKYEAYYG